MKIQVRRTTPTSKTQPITVREKIIYSCKRCNNRYYAYYFFCPQCLGEVLSSTTHSSLLQIRSCSPEHLEEAVPLLRKLSGIDSFDFQSAFKYLPWICMVDSDPAILRTWKECLEAGHISTEILQTPPESKKQRRKPHPPLFNSNAPFPQFLPLGLINTIRATGASIPSATARLQWAETIALSFNILERIYKSSAELVLFYDFIFQIEEHIREFLSRFSSAKWTEQTFIKRNDRLREQFGQMESEIDAVEDRVQDQL